MNTFFTSDTHYGHKNIIEYCNRPFQDVFHMTEMLIQNWNSIVQPGDTVYHIGDVSFMRDAGETAEVLGRLNGNIHLVLGNHDDPKKVAIWEHQLASTPVHMREVKVEGQRIVMCHYAMRVWNHSHHGAWHLYGHSHGSLPDLPDSLSTDVGVDSWDYFPVPFSMLKKHMEKKSFTPLDHHDGTR